MPFDFWCRFKETIFFLRCSKLFTEIVSVFIPLERGKLEKKFNCDICFSQDGWLKVEFSRNLKRKEASCPFFPTPPPIKISLHSAHHKRDDLTTPTQLQLKPLDRKR